MYNFTFTNLNDNTTIINVMTIQNSNTDNTKDMINTVLQPLQTDD